MLFFKATETLSQLVEFANTHDFANCTPVVTPHELCMQVSVNSIMTGSMQKMAEGAHLVILPVQQTLTLLAKLQKTDKSITF